MSKSDLPLISGSSSSGDLRGITNNSMTKEYEIVNCEEAPNDSDSAGIPSNFQKSWCTNKTANMVVCIFLMSFIIVVFTTLQGIVGIQGSVITGLTVPDPDITTKIIGGEDALRAEFPHQVIFKYKGKAICGGSILKPNIVITAAHCIFTFSSEPEDFSVVAGEHTLSEDEGSEQEIAVLQIRIHDDYDDFNDRNDIALVLLAKNFEFNDYVKEIKIPESTTSSKQGMKTVVIGWGVKHETNNGQPYNVLQKVEVPLVGASDCGTVYGDVIIQDGSIICAGYPEGKRDACQADSGGSLLTRDGNSCTLIGIVSWGHGCGRPGFPGVYTHVPFFGKWIEETIESLYQETPH